MFIKCFDFLWEKEMFHSLFRFSRRAALQWHQVVYKWPLRKNQLFFHMSQFYNSLVYFSFSNISTLDFASPLHLGTSWWTWKALKNNFFYYLLYIQMTISSIFTAYIHAECGNLCISYLTGKLGWKDRIRLEFTSNAAHSQIWCHVFEEKIFYFEICSGNLNYVPANLLLGNKRGSGSSCDRVGPIRGGQTSLGAIFPHCKVKKNQTSVGIILYFPLAALVCQVLSSDWWIDTRLFHILFCKLL